MLSQTGKNTYVTKGFLSQKTPTLYIGFNETGLIKLSYVTFISPSYLKWLQHCYFTQNIYEWFQFANRWEIKM